MEKGGFKRLEENLRLKGYSSQTIKAYLYYNRNFLNFCGKSVRQVASSDIRKYLYFLTTKGISEATLNLIINALKYYYSGFFKRKFFVSIPRPKRNKKLPVVLSKDELKKLFGRVENVKYKLLLALMYSAGLRVSEAAKLKVKDLDFGNQVLIVRSGKGGKDRQTILSEILLNVLEKFVYNKSLNDYVFESTRGGCLTGRSIQKAFSKALEKAKIKKAATCHSLRHSFATHLLEQGTDIRYIQELLGHKRLETTQIYTKVSSQNLKSIKSPLDNLSLYG